MEDIVSGSLVILHCINPQEKYWGYLLRLETIGAVFRGLNLGSVEDWIAQEKLGQGGYVAPSTLFIPMHRIERIYLDERSTVAESIGERFEAACGVDVKRALESGGCKKQRNTKDEGS